MPTPYAVSSDLVSAWPAKSLAVANYLDSALAAKYDSAPAINAQIGTTYTFVLADATAGKTITASNAAASTYTVPPQSSVAFSAGALLRVTNLGAGVVTFAGGVGVTVTNTAGTLAQYQTATLVRTGSDAWTVIPFAGTPSGMVLTAFAAPSAASSVIISDCFSAAYDNYRLVIRLAAAATGGYCTFTLRTGSTDAITNYNYQMLAADSTTITGARSASQSSAKLGYVQANGHGIYISDFSSPFLAAATMYFGLGVSSAPNSSQENYAGSHSTATSYESIKISFGAAMTGTIKIYGYRNS